MKKKFNKQKLRRIFFGMNFVDGLFYKIFIYILLISFSYIYLYPLLFMLSNSLMGPSDIINDGVRWIPTKFYFESYKQAFNVLNIKKEFFKTTGYVLKVSLLSTFTSMIVGYGFAKFNFPLKKILFVLMLATFILPDQITMASTMIILRKLNIISTTKAMTIPAFLGQGINSAIYILIFYSFFRTIPKVLSESAMIDGASEFKIFRSIAVPLAIPSIVIVFLFSFVWYWNETFITGLFAGGNITLPLKLLTFRSDYMSLYPPGSSNYALNEGVSLAANMLVILPLLLIYFIGQKQFVNSIDKTGITGE